MKNLNKFLICSLLWVVNSEYFIFPKEQMDTYFKSEAKIKNVFLNHTYAIIDENTYDEIKKSDFLKNEFCHCEEKTHTGANDRGQMSWTGFYLTGENTYIELFNKKDQENLYAMTAGNVGLGFSVDSKEEIEKIYALFKQKFGDSVNNSLMEKNLAGTNIPWFYAIEATNNFFMLPQFDTWIMAYHKDYCKTLHHNSIARKDYNKEYNAVPFDKTKLFKDIEEITLLLNNDIKRKFIERQILLGYTCKEIKDCTICRGPEITLILKSSQNDTCKLLQLKISLNHAITNTQTYTFGISTLTLEHQTATWTLE